MSDARKRGMIGRIEKCLDLVTRRISWPLGRSEGEQKPVRSGLKRGSEKMVTDNLVNSFMEFDQKEEKKM